MSVTRQLGLQYLWVDRYCIDQENKQEKHILISTMDEIYRQSEVTIIAAAGSDAAHGLPGISRYQVRHSAWGRSQKIQVEYNPGFEIEISQWSQRGWTYQESVLSRRRLVFTTSQIYFQCLRSYRWELVKRDRRWQKFTSQVFPLRGIGITSAEIFDRISEYSTRELSYDSDALNAFAGIFNAFKSLDLRQHFWGLPTCEHTESEPWSSTEILIACALVW